jgi:preprotein translocase SecE subunit
MAFGLYKPGQGYWVRVLSATMAGVVILAAAAWLWNELEKAGQYIPHPTWTLTLAPGASGTVAPGQTIELFGERGDKGQPEDLGNATVVAYDQSGTGRITINHAELRAGRDPASARAVGPTPGAGGATISGTLSGNAQPNTLFDPLYLQAAGVAVLVVLGAWCTFWLVGVRPSTVEFLIATDGEMKKVNWSTRRDIVGSTWVVILWSVLLAGGLWVVDFLFQAFFKMIGVLQS